MTTLLLLVWVGWAVGVRADSDGRAARADGDAWRPMEPVTRPPAPEAARAGWVRNPIDAFVSARHEARGLRPRPEAPPVVLLRRVYLDLTGLPPTLEEVRAFERDGGSRRAYERAVDRLLASPRYGERWGRHWMDIWRYADRDDRRLNNGLEMAPHMWRWRDWIVASLNGDAGYDAMIRQMLAGDEIAPGDVEVLRATAYLARNKTRSRDAWLHETVDHAVQAFAGLSIQCARCHDHPTEPIAQREYYALRAVFEPLGVRTRPMPGSEDAKKNGYSHAYDADPDEKTYLYIRGNELNPDKDHPVAPGVPALVNGPAFEVEPVTVDDEKRDRKRRSSGRRLALARWLTDRANPLTARVAVNHIWARHFGEPLAPSVTNLGPSGDRPSHPALLDWLACELMDNGWKMKAIHRLIVTSNTYRTASTPDPANHAIDPDNRDLWRFSPRRMEAELVRDAILHVAGRLDPVMGGPEIDPDEADRTPRRSLYFQTSPYTQMTFLVTFDGAAVQECYRRTESVQPQQALALLNSRLAVQSARRLARDIDAETGTDPTAFIDLAFRTLLSRFPTGEEARICAEHLEEQTRALAGNAEARRGATDDRADTSRPAADPALRAREGLVHLLINHHEFITIR